MWASGLPVYRSSCDGICALPFSGKLGPHPNDGVCALPFGRMLGPTPYLNTSHCFGDTAGSLDSVC